MSEEKVKAFFQPGTSAAIPHPSLSSRACTPRPAGMKRGGGLGGCRCLLLGLMTCLRGVLQPAETLEVKMESQTRKFLNADVMFPCYISGYPAPELNINKTAVTWYLETYGVNGKKELHSVVAGEQTSHRNGSRVDESKLKKGNAALFLPQIQLNEGGTYICSVTVTPDKAEGTTILELVAQPIVTLLPKEVTIERDKEKTVSCTVNKFYPSLIVIRWQKNSKHTSDKSVSPEDICTGAFVEQGDGTFNATSKLRLQPTSQDDGNIYTCIVEHKSFPIHSALNVTLKVTDPKTDSNLLAYVTTALITVFAVIGGMVYHMYKKYLSKRPPTIFPIIGNTELKHLEETELQCLFSGFRPKPLDITFFLITQSRKQQLFSWNTNTAGDSEKGNESIPLLQHSEKNFRFYPIVETKENRTFDVSCKICIVPDVMNLDKFELSVNVTHEALQPRLHTESKSFKVIAPPSLDQIQCSTDEPRPDEALTLSCRIYSFFPETIEVHWYKGEEPVPGLPFVGKPTKGPSGFFFCSSRIKYLPEATDAGKRFTCKANLEGSQQYKESSWEMKVLVFTPNVSQIACEPTVPVYGKPITLSCLVKDFYPPECDICWKKGFKELAYATVKTEDPQLDTESHLYSRKSEVSFTPNPEDHAVDFFFEISHCSKKLRQKYPLTLKGFPKITGIFLEPSDAEYGNTLSLTCSVMDFYPRDIKIEWLDGDKCLTDGVVTEGPVEDSTTDCFKLSSSLQLTPTALDYDKTISFRVTHQTLKNPIMKNVYLKLPAKPPIVSDIKARAEESSTSLRLETSISDFAPPDIRVVWYKEWKRIKEDSNPRNIQIGENHLCWFTSSIEVNLKAKDFRKAFRCEVFHLATKSFQEKSWKA